MNWISFFFKLFLFFYHPEESKSENRDHWKPNHWKPKNKKSDLEIETGMHIWNLFKPPFIFVEFQLPFSLDLNLLQKWNEGLTWKTLSSAKLLMSCFLPIKGKIMSCEIFHVLFSTYWNLRFSLSVPVLAWSDCDQSNMSWFTWSHQSQR